MCVYCTVGKHTSILSTEDIEGKEHSIGEGGGLLLAGEVEAIDLPGVPPLVEGWCGLVVLETLHYWVVDDHLWKTRKRRMQERQSSVRKTLETILFLSGSFYFSRIFLFVYLKNDLNPQMAAPIDVQHDHNLHCLEGFVDSEWAVFCATIKIKHFCVWEQHSLSLCFSLLCCLHHEL